MSGYIMDLRKEIGSRPIILTGAGVILVDNLGRILLQKRTDNHYWGIPGGSMELGETFEDTARREVLEETGLIVGELNLFYLNSGPSYALYVSQRSRSLPGMHHFHLERLFW